MSGEISTRVLRALGAEPTVMAGSEAVDSMRRKIIEVHQRWRYAANDYALLIENKGSGMSLIQDLAREHIHAIAIEPDGNKVMRMNAQTGRIEAGAVWLPRQAAWLDQFRHELMAFPVGRYSDQVDAFSQALYRAFNRQGGEFSWGWVTGLNS